MMQWRNATVVGLIISGMGVFTAEASSPKLYYSPRDLSNGYNKTSFDQFSVTVTNKFGADNVFLVSNFTEASAFVDADALIINARVSTGVLSSQEQTNILAFVNTGKPVLFLGERAEWANWNTSFLSLFGDQHQTFTGTVQTGIVTGPAHPLHITGDTVQLNSPGTISGSNGRNVYRLHTNQILAKLYGPSENALAFLDTNAFGSSLVGNVQFYGRFANWFHDQAVAAMVVPEPTSLALIGLTSAMLMVRRSKTA